MMKNLSFKLLITAATFAAFSFLPACNSNTADETTKDDDNAGVLDSSSASQLPDTTIMTDQPAATGGPAVPAQGDSTRNTKDSLEKP